MKVFLCAVLVGVFTLGWAGVSHGQVRAGITQQMPGEILVRFKAGVSTAKIQHINQSLDSTVLSVSPRGGFLRLKISNQKSVEEMVAVYQKNPNVEYAEANFIATAHFTPNDPLYQPYQWNFDNSVFGGIGMEAAWNLQTGDPSIIVAVVDTGVAYEDYSSYSQAPDLANTSFVPGYDFINNDPHPNDDHGHGTHVTGTIAQSTDNNYGLAGVAFGSSIMPVKVLGSNGSGSYAAVANGIYFAADHGAQVINMSLGGGSPSVTLENALQYAHNKGVTMVCSAGNGAQSGSPPNYPAAYDAYCIAVGATRYDETRSYYSNIGDYLDIVAPGGDRRIDQNGDGYGDGILQQTFGSNPNVFNYYFYQGTSMAAPHVSGVAALLIAYGITGTSNIRDALEGSARDLGTPGWDPEYGWGLLDAYGALTYHNDPAEPPPPPDPIHDVAVGTFTGPQEVVEGEIVSLEITVTNLGDFAESFVMSLTDTGNNQIIETRNIGDLAAKDSTQIILDWDTQGSTAGDHVLQVDLSVVNGETSVANNSATHTVTIVVPPAAPSLSVSDISMTLRQSKRSSQAQANVSVVDALGQQVTEAMVTADWYLNQNFLGTQNALTNNRGLARFKSDRIAAGPGDTFTIVITGITKSGYIYDESGNLETSDSIAVPNHQSQSRE